MADVDDVFGRRKDRPDHPDFWRISEIILQLDGPASDPTTPEAERDRLWNKRVADVGDKESIMYAAVQRAKLAFGVPGGAAFGITGAGNLTPHQQATAASLWIEAFVFGAMFAQRGGHQEK